MKKLKLFAQSPRAEQWFWFVSLYVGAVIIVAVVTTFLRWLLPH